MKASVYTRMALLMVGLGLDPALIETMGAAEFFGLSKLARARRSS